MTIFYHVPLENIVPNPWQTRKTADPEHIKELAGDIARNGMLQNPVGRQLPDSKVQLAFGHNRLAAYRLLHQESAVATDLAGHDFSSMAVDVVVLTDQQMADYAWSENEKRQNLSPMDRCRAIQSRIEAFGWTHKVAGEHLGMDRATVSNILRLGKLPGDLQEKVDTRELSERQATALLGLYDLPEALREAAEANKYTRYKPSILIQEAAAGMSSDNIRSFVQQIVNNQAVDLKRQALFDLKAIKVFDASDPALYPHIERIACVDCPFLFKRDEHLFCTNPPCFNDKQSVWKIHRLGLASEAAGIPILESWQEYNPHGGLNNSFSNDVAQKVLAAGCENLRVVFNINTYGAAHPWQDFPDIELICKKRSGFCTCEKGLAALHKLDRIAHVGLPNVVGAPTSAAMLDPINPADSVPDPRYTPAANPAPALTAEGLKEAHLEVKRAEKGAKDQLDVVMQNAAKVLSEYLQGLNLGAWRWLHDGMSYSSYAGDEIIKDCTVDDLTQGIAYVLIKKEYWHGRPALDTIDALRKKLEKYGISTYEVFRIPEEEG